MDKIFKACPKCRFEWKSRNELLNDKNVKIIGYQANFIEPEEGLYLFNHTIDNCNTTFSMKTKDYKDMYEGTVYPFSKYGEPECKGYCKDENNLSICGEQCKYAPFREIASLIKKL